VSGGKGGKYPTAGAVRLRREPGESGDSCRGPNIGHDMFNCYSINVFWLNLIKCGSVIFDFGAGFISRGVWTLVE
jgi:hypothetical protein